MGSGIATALILSDIPVVLKEVNADFLQKGIDRIKANLQSRAKKGRLPKDKFDKAFSLLKGTLDYDDFNKVDLVIEAAVEDVQLKQQIFSKLETVCSSNAILASNTSTINLNVIGEKSHSQDRIIGAHFFSPAQVMPLLEIVRTEKTSPQTILDLMTVGKIIKKVPVVVGNCTGFAVNRVFFPYSQAAAMLVDLGVNVYRIDIAIKAFGMPMGPFRLADFGGFGVNVAVRDQFLNAYPERVYNSQLVPLMFQDKRLGESNGKGFYLYDEKRRPRPAPELKEYVEKARKSANIMPHGKPITVSDQDIVEMILFPVVNEASRVLDEGVVVKASDLDIASVLGMGFPAHKGGIVFWADSVGASYIFSRLKVWSEIYGNFFKPSSILEDTAKTGITLSAAAKNTTAKYTVARL
ncbi:hypothetical protein O6H91_01G053100 [Diphasiastrum complanatum]|nr:hypothetical protein O6H91_01G053100 [Diphasiastrum complanatum]